MVRFAIVSRQPGASKNNGDILAVIDATGPHPHVVWVISPGTGPEGFGISSDGKWAAAALTGGSGAGKA